MVIAVAPMPPQAPAMLVRPPLGAGRARPRGYQYTPAQPVPQGAGLGTEPRSKSEAKGGPRDRT